MLAFYLGRIVAPPDNTGNLQMDVATNAYRANRFPLNSSSTPIKVHVFTPEAVCLRRKHIATRGDQSYLRYTSLAIRRDYLCTFAPLVWCVDVEAKLLGRILPDERF